MERMATKFWISISSIIPRSLIVKQQCPQIWFYDEIC
jgi:hypothetical protein